MNVIDWEIQNEVNGIIHVASPFPVTNKDFMREIRQALKIPIGLPNPAFLTLLGALFIGTEAELVLSGRRVVSTVLDEKKFAFKYPQLQAALIQLL